MEITAQSIITVAGIIGSAIAGWFGGQLAAARKMGADEEKNKQMRHDLDELKKDTGTSFAAIHQKHDYIQNRHEELIRRWNDKSDQVLVTQGKIEGRIEAMFTMIEQQNENIRQLINAKIQGG